MEVRQSATAALALLLAVTPLGARRFFPDDPLRHEPTPLAVEKVKRVKLADFYDLLENQLGHPGERQVRDRPVRARSINTLDEPLQGAWYTYRHYYQPLSRAELQQGVGGNRPPVAHGIWTVTAAKTEGVTPGFTIKDETGTVYLLKFDPVSNPEMATGADMIGSRFFHALGYHVPDNYLVTFPAERLQVDPQAQLSERNGRRRAMTPSDIRLILKRVPQRPDGTVRALASRYLPGTPVGPFRYYGTRGDDPNDTIPHEHRRELRGLYVFAAWLAHDDVRAINTLDTLVSEPVRHLRHHLIDFGSILGSGSTRINSPREGFTNFVEWREIARQVFTLGLAVPHWARVRYPAYPAIGLIESKHFQPGLYKPEYPNMAFEARLPDDEFWGAKQVMAFTDDQIRAVVEMAQYSDPAARDYLIKTLCERRDKIGRAFFRKVLPLDRFAVRDGQLVFDDLAERHWREPRRPYQITWSRFDNQREQRTPLSATGPQVPQEQGEYLVATITGPGERLAVDVYLRTNMSGSQVVGIERKW